jgi:hypothetical protein
VLVGSVVDASVAVAATVSLMLWALPSSPLPHAASAKETATAAGMMVRDNEIMGVLL